MYANMSYSVLIRPFSRQMASNVTSIHKVHQFCTPCDTSTSLGQSGIQSSGVWPGTFKSGSCGLHVLSSKSLASPGAAELHLWAEPWLSSRCH